MAESETQKKSYEPPKLRRLTSQQAKEELSAEGVPAYRVLYGFGRWQASDDEANLSLSARGSLPHMLQYYSQRAKQILFIARFKAGKDGTNAVDLQHLLEAIVIEDQGGQELSKLFGFDPTAQQIQGHTFEFTSTPFFSSEIASQLLTKIRALSSHSQPVATSQDLPISEDLLHALSIALELKRKFQTERVEPLHLLAAGLEDKSSKPTRIFLDAGITREMALEAIRKSK